MNSLNILYTCDNAYLPLTSISMASVICNNPMSHITFYIATETEDDDNFRKLRNFYKDNKNIEIKYLDCTKYDYLLKEKNLDKWGSNSYYVYWKMFAYDLLDCDYIWYLDSDVICLKEINNPQINKSLGVVLDSAHAIFNKLAHIDENYYLINTGSLFVDVKKWKENKCTEKIVEYTKQMNHKPLLCDEDIMSVSLQEDIEVINPKYNYLIGYDYYGVDNSFEMYSLDKKPFYSRKEVKDAKDKVVFYHCLGGVFGRPWEENNDSPIKEEFVKYRDLSAWSNYSRPRNKSAIDRIEKIMEILPRGLYNKVHNLAIRKYLERISKC